MNNEIQRRFLVRPELWHAPPGSGTRIQQGYLSTAPERIVRVQVANGRGFITVRGSSGGLSRREFEYPIPAGDATELLENFCTPRLIAKTRHQQVVEGRLWELDVFEGESAGLLLAQVDVASATAPLKVPRWAGREVTNDPRYLGTNLARHPFSEWGKP